MGDHFNFGLIHFIVLIFDSFPSTFDVNSIFIFKQINFKSLKTKMSWTLTLNDTIERN